MCMSLPLVGLGFGGEEVVSDDTGQNSPWYVDTPIEDYCPSQLLRELF